MHLHPVLIQPQEIGEGPACINAKSNHTCA